MHGFFNKCVELFLRQTHGADAWLAIATAIGCDRRGFQTMRIYSPETSTALLVQTCDHLHLTQSQLLEDIGSWLPSNEKIRRLLRFSGSDYTDFVLSLEELQGRSEMVIPDLGIPPIEVAAQNDGAYQITAMDNPAFWHPIIAGMLRYMADDYGVLAHVEGGKHSLWLYIPDRHFGAGNEFTINAGHNIMTSQP